MEVCTVDRQVIHGKDPVKWGNQVEAYINEKIRNGKDVQLIAEDGTIMTLTENTAGKAKYRNWKTVKGIKRKYTDAEYKAKLRAETHIDELVRISEYKEHDNDKKITGLQGMDLTTEKRLSWMQMENTMR